MHVRVSVLLAAACVCALADDNQERRSKLPYVADAVGNTIRPPSSAATVGSPVNLLTPDRYEFYTFDESGELVKRLMTLEEIQAIVAAGEETDGLVTFANDNQPTIGFNFSQPPYTKVHNVVTNVQNVLKAQMEAHKNKPQVPPTLDTPDVSDSWSLILPSIFGNTGVDIVPDKISDTFITPETETIEFSSNLNDDNLNSKEGNHQISSSSTPVYEGIKKDSVMENTIKRDKISTTSTSTTTTTPKTTTTTTTSTTTTTTTTTTSKPRITSTAKTTTSTFAPTTKTTTLIPTTKKAMPVSSTTTTNPVPSTIKTTTTAKPTAASTTAKPSTTTSKFRVTIGAQPEKYSVSTTRRPIPSTTRKSSTTTHKLEKISSTTTTKPISTSSINLLNPTQKTSAATTTQKTIQYEKISTLVAVPTIAYITDKTTRRPISTTKPSHLHSISTTKSGTTTTNSPTTSFHKVHSSEMTDKPTTIPGSLTSSSNNQEYEKINSTTITTQSVSPSTTISSTEFVTIQSAQNIVIEKTTPSSISTNDNGIKDETVVPLFDVAQSISQIASDLGGNYAPLPTATNLLDTTKINNMDLESKENLEIDIPSGVENDSQTKDNNTNVGDNFIKLSTLEAHPVENKTSTDKVEEKVGIADSLIIQKFESTSHSTTSSTSTTSEPPISITTTTHSTTAQTPSIKINSPILSSTTIDPIVSESMGNLLSQVVNSIPPESIIESQKLPTSENNNKSKPDILKETSLENNTSEMMSKTENNLELEKNYNNEKQKDPNGSSEKTNANNENKDNLVPISVINTKNQLTEKLPGFKPNEMVNNIKNSPIKPLQQNKLILNKQDKKESLGTTEIYNKIDSTTTASDLKHIVIDNSHGGDKNLLDNSKNKKNGNKESELFPKVDEFKKKIQKVNIDDKELANERNNSWKLISTVSPPKANEILKEKHKTEGFYTPESIENKNIILDFSKENQGLEVTTKDLGEDIVQFTELCNELAFRYWNDMISNIDKKRSFVLSPYSITSMLAMMFMGARGATSGEMNEILRLDDMVTFNPHFTLKNISDSIDTNPGSGVMISAFIRELYSDRNKGKLLTFYKERAQHFYNGHVEEINFKLISDIIRRRTNLLVKRYTWGKITEYMKTNTIVMHPPLAAFSTNIFQTDCTGSSVEGRDGEMYFVVSPNVRQRRLVPVPAVVYRSNFLAGYDPVLDATAAALGNTNSIVSTLFLMPGQQGNVVHAEDLEALEKRLLDSNPTAPSWNRLLRTLLPRVGLELQIPRFSHKSTFNVSSTLKRMGLKDLFDAQHADLGGLNGPSKDLYLSDMIQSTTFVTCGEDVIGEQHHIEEYPENLETTSKSRTARWVHGWDEPRDYQRAFHDPHDVGDAMHLPLHLRPRQARLPARNAQPARLKFDRPFLFFVRHNPSGMILYVGRYNPRLLP